MSFAPDINGLDVDLSKCDECEHHKSTAVFELCMHTDSRYSIAGKVDFHTISHMRSIGSCRPEATKFSPITTGKRN